jgi:uncharacterized protein YkwD
MCATSKLTDMYNTFYTIGKFIPDFIATVIISGEFISSAATRMHRKNMLMQPDQFPAGFLRHLLIYSIMNWIDIILLLIILFAVIGGWYRGFIMGTLDLITWVGSLVLGYLFYPYVAGWLGKIFTLGNWLLPVAFLLTTIVARIILGLITRAIASPLSERDHNTVINKFLGIIPGAINGWIYAVIFSALMLALPLRDIITANTRESRFAGKMAMQAEWANRKLAPVFDDAIRQTMNSLTIKPGSKQSVSLPFKYDKPEVRPSLEAKMLEMVNKERIANGLKPLQNDPEMTLVARAHSVDMFKRGYFAHNTPEGKNPFDRMKQANISFSEAGENLALAQTLEIAHTNLMNSPGHRANILSPAFGRLGIGVLDGGFYGLMISQEFRN